MSAGCRERKRKSLRPFCQQGSGKDLSHVLSLTRIVLDGQLARHSLLVPLPLEQTHGATRLLRQSIIVCSNAMKRQGSRKGIAVCHPQPEISRFCVTAGDQGGQWAVATFPYAHSAVVWWRPRGTVGTQPAAHLQRKEAADDQGQQGHSIGLLQSPQH